MMIWHKKRIQIPSWPEREGASTKSLCPRIFRNVQIPTVARVA